MQVLRLLKSLFMRDMRVALSYKAAFALNAASAVAGIVFVFFLSQAVGGGVAPIVDEYGGGYFGFAVLGVALANFMAIGIGGLAGKIREGLLMGTLEFMMISPNRLPVLLLGSTLWSHAYAGVSLALYLIVGATLGIDFTSANVPVALLAFVLAVVSFNALGLVAASAVIVVKQGDPVTLVLSSASVLLAGVLYPTAVLPPWMETAGRILPLTHALEVIRRATFAGEGLATLWPSLGALAALAAAYSVAGSLACSAAVRLAQRDGSLAYY